ncbi:MAG: peptidoglycan-binding domain-containing protein [Chthoniobacterales bacterium]
MGRFPTCLLVLGFELSLFSDVFANDQVRRVQEELRKRHLFYGEITGEISPPLTAAVGRYQERKGFARTGFIDLDICISLGIARRPLGVTPAFVIDNHGDVRGANGESLDRSVTSRWAMDERATQFERALIAHGDIALASAGSDIEGALKNDIAARRRSLGHPRQRTVQKENNPIVLAYHSVDHAIKFLFGETDVKKKRRIAKHL